MTADVEKLSNEKVKVVFPFHYPAGITFRNHIVLLEFPQMCRFQVSLTLRGDGSRYMLDKFPPCELIVGDFCGHSSIKLETKAWMEKKYDNVIYSVQRAFD